MTLKEFKKLKKGDKVIVKKSLKAFYLEHAFVHNKVGSAIIDEVSARGYVLDIMFGLGFPYTMTYLGPRTAADPINTAYFRLDLGKGLVLDAYQERQSLKCRK